MVASRCPTSSSRPKPAIPASPNMSCARSRSALSARTCASNRLSHDIAESLVNDTGPSASNARGSYVFQKNKNGTGRRDDGGGLDGVLGGCKLVELAGGRAGGSLRAAGQGLQSTLIGNL